MSGCSARVCPTTLAQCTARPATQPVTLAFNSNQELVYIEEGNPVQFISWGFGQFLSTDIAFAEQIAPSASTWGSMTAVATAHEDLPAAGLPRSLVFAVYVDGAPVPRATAVVDIVATVPGDVVPKGTQFFGFVTFTTPIAAGSMIAVGVNGDAITSTNTFPLAASATLLLYNSPL